MVQVLSFVVLAICGFTACAEFGSYAFVHPVVRRLEVAAHVQVEQGLVRTFGRVMPFLMTGSLAALVVWTSAVWSDATPVVRALAVAATAAWALGLATTIAVNVGINLRTARWDPVEDPARWRAMRSRWETFQGFRSWAYLVSFLLVAAAVAMSVDL